MDDLAYLFIGLIVTLGGLVLAIVLPLVSWRRVSRLKREVTGLRERIAVIEERERLRETGGAAASPVVAPAPVETPQAADRAAPPQAEAVPAPPPVAVPSPSSVPPVPPAAARPTAAAAIEQAIGGRLMLWVGTIVTVLGVGFFLKYAFEHRWITEWMRVALGLAGGLLLVGAGDRFVRRGFVLYGQILTGGGFAVLYLAIYAAFDFYGLIGRTPAFLLLLIVTAAAAAVADRHRGAGLALMAVGGGFLTPFLVGSGTGAQVTLFTYDALLVAGTMVLAHRRAWPQLNLLSAVLTALTVLAWADRYYTDAKWLTTELFLTLFCGMFVYILRENRRSTHPLAPATTGVLFLWPIGYHLASLGILGSHGIALLVYLIAVAMVGVGATIRFDAAGWRPALWAAVVLPLLVWIGDHQAPRWMAPSLIAAGAVSTLFALAWYEVAVRQERPLQRSDLALVHLNGLGLMAAAYLALEEVRLAAAPMAAALLGLLHGGVAWYASRFDPRAALQALGVAFTLVTIAVALEFDGPWLTVALGAEGAALAWIGLRLDYRLFRTAGAGLLAAGVIRWLSTADVVRPDFRVILNASFFVGMTLVGLMYAVAWLYRRDGGALPDGGRRGVAAAVVSASVLTVVVLTTQNDAFWSLRRAVSADAHFARSLTLSLIWAVCATVLIVVGMWKDYAPVRLTAIALFGLTVLKVFLSDLSALGGIYRVLGFLAIGVILLAVSFLYQQSRRRDGSPAGAPRTETPPAAVAEPPVDHSS